MIRALLSVAAISCLGVAAAASITFADVCEPARFVAKEGRLEIYCQGQTVPWLTLADCGKPGVKRLGAGKYAITCG